MRRRNPETAELNRALSQMKRQVEESRSESRAVSSCVRFLGDLGYANAQRPEVHNATVERATLRFYVWRDTPFGDDLILAAGPSFAAKVELAGAVSSTPGVGIYIQTHVLGEGDKLPKSVRAASAARASTAARAPRPAAAPRAARARIPRVAAAPRGPEFHVAPLPPRSPRSSAFPASGEALFRSRRSRVSHDPSGDFRSLAAEAAEAERAAQAEASRLAAEARAQSDREAAAVAARGKRALSSFLSFLESAE